MKATTTPIVLLLLLFSISQLNGQHFRLDLNIEPTLTKFDPGNGPVQRINTNFRNDDPFNPFRIKFFPQVRINETFGVSGDFLLDTKATTIDGKNDQPFRVDGLYFSVRGLLNNKVNFWLGKIPTPVGTFSARSYSHLNPLIGFPLAYHYKVPHSGAQAFDETTSLRFRDNLAPGVTSIYEACWITGASVFGDVGHFTYTLAVGQGTLTNPEAKENGGIQIAGHIGWEPNEWLTAGISGGVAPYLEHEAGLPAGIGIRDPQHHLFGVDIKAKFDDLTIFIEGVYNSWDTPQYTHDKNVEAYMAYVEGQYFLSQDFYLAARFDKIMYDNITNPVNGQQTPWGYDVTRIEAGFGFSPTSHLILKGVVQHNALDHPTIKSITVYAFQAMVRLEQLQTLIGLGRVEDY